MRVPGSGGDGAEGWAGSNVDLGTFAEIDAELRERARLMDEALAEAKAANMALRESQGAYMIAFARSVAMSSERATAGKEREAKTDNVEARVVYESAKLRWELAQLGVRTAENQLNGAQTRAANLRRQVSLDGTTPSWSGGGRDDGKVPF